MQTFWTVVAIILFGGLIIWELSLRFRIFKFLVKVFRKYNR
jgi:hypothetical protein